MSEDNFGPKFPRGPERRHAATVRYTTQVLRQFGRARPRWRGRLGLDRPVLFCRRGLGTGLRAAAGLIAPSYGRRVFTKARYSILAGDLSAARAHMAYILRDGVGRDGKPGRAYDAGSDDTDVRAFLRRSAGDRYQFRFLVSAEDGARLANPRAVIRGLMAQMQRDLDGAFEWVAVNHFNTGHPHTHIVVRGRDNKGQQLVIARDYIVYGMRARAQALISLELGPESELERLEKLTNEVAQERFTQLDRSLLAAAKDGVLAIAAMHNSDPVGQTFRVGRLKTLQKLGLAEERRAGVWVLGAQIEPKLRRLGERADKFKMMQRALKEAGIDRAAAALALFERGPRRAPLIGKVVGIGMIDEISDRSWVVIDAIDGRIHYAELGRLKAADRPRRGNLVLLSAGALGDKPSAASKLQVLSPVDVEQHCRYEGPTWIDQALIARREPDPNSTGFGGELRGLFAARLRWLHERRLVLPSGPAGAVAPTADMMHVLRQMEKKRLVAALSRELGATYIAGEGERRIAGIYERAIVTPTGKLALIRREDTFTLAPWKPGLEPLRGQAVMGWVGASRMTWTPDRGRTLPER